MVTPTRLTVSISSAQSNNSSRRPNTRSDNFKLTGKRAYFDNVSIKIQRHAHVSQCDHIHTKATRRRNKLGAKRLDTGAVPRRSKRAAIQAHNCSGGNASTHTNRLKHKRGIWAWVGKPSHDICSTEISHANNSCAQH